MSRKAAAKGRQKAASPLPKAATTSPIAGSPASDSSPFRPPLRPRPRLFYALLIGLIGWVAFLLVLYFTTVYPNRDTQPDPHSASRVTANATAMSRGGISARVLRPTRAPASRASSVSA